MNVEMPHQQKINSNKYLSTQQSKNSMHLVPRNTAKEHQYGDCSLRLFTFMNFKDESKQKAAKSLKRKKSSRQCKKKQVCKLSSSNINKEDNSGLIQMIEESRKKRERFLKLIIDEECSFAPQNNRKCKTPTARKKDTISVTPRGNEKKPTTHRMSLGTAVSPKSTLFRARSSLGSIAHMKKSSLKENYFAQKKKEPGICQKKKQTNEKQLLRKKEQLQKQLLEINQSLFLKKNKGGKVKGKNSHRLS